MIPSGKLAWAFLLIGWGAPCWATALAPDLAGPGACAYSDATFNADNREVKPPTLLRLMEVRYREMVEAARAYRCSGIASVAFDGHSFFQAGFGDSPGLAELVPGVSRAMGMPLARSYDAVEFTLICLSILLGFTGFSKLCSGGRTRIEGVVLFAFLLLAEVCVADEYVFQTAPLIAGIPWLIHFTRTHQEAKLWLAVILLAFGCSWCSQVRSGTLLICFAFLVPLCASRRPLWKGFALFLAAGLASAPATLIASRMVEQRNAFLAKVGEPDTAITGHPLWHSVYIGLGFIPNHEVQAYRDEVAFAKVASIDPAVETYSPQYEAILKNEVLRIAKDKPLILIENLFSKGIIMALLAMVLLLPARRVVFRRQEWSWMDLAFGLAIAVSGLGGILVMPRPSYLISYVCVLLLYAGIRRLEMFAPAASSVQRMRQPWRTDGLDHG